MIFRTISRTPITTLASLRLDPMEPGFEKPAGRLLWLSEIGEDGICEWRRWCEVNRFRVEDLRHTYDFKVDLGQIARLKDAVPFIENAYSGQGWLEDLGHNRINFPSLRRKTNFGGFWLTQQEYWQYRFDRFHGVNFSDWNVGTLVIWDTKVIIKCEEVLG